MEQTPEPVTIRFAVWDWQRDIYDALAEAFTEANPDLLVQFVSITELLGPVDFTKPIQIPDLPSVADVFPFLQWWPDLASTGQLRDLTPFIEADADFHPEDFYPGVLESYRRHGGTWALPVGLDAYAIVYHKGIFDQAGVAYPEPGWTWEELTIKAQTLTEREGEHVLRWGLALDTLAPTSLIVESRAGPLIDYTADPPTPRFDQPDIVEAVRWYTDLYRQSVITYPVSIDDSRVLYGGQVAAMWAETFSNWSMTSPRTDVGVVPFPVDNPDSRSTLLIPQALGMSAGTRYPDAAWRWMEFLTRQNLVGLLLGFDSLPIGYLPVRRSVAEAGGLWESLDTETAAAMQYALQHGYVDQDIYGGASALSAALDAILSGEKSVEDALAEANVEAIELMRKERERLA
ncbi:MAG: extracellular solute-binding protein, partial [Anaerolineae bacterium]|nr:extracellular solute-binding protein [Anaerolineae bacterium]